MKLYTKSSAFLLHIDGSDIMNAGGSEGIYHVRYDYQLLRITGTF